MTESRVVPNVATVPPGCAFLPTVVESLCSGTLVPGFSYDPANPLSLADVTIFVPTRRSARVLRSAFVDGLGGRSAILPSIRTLGETEEDSFYFDMETPDGMDMPPPLPGAARLIELGILILAWRNGLPRAVLQVHAESPLIAPASPADAIWLARSLAEVMDALETEALEWTSLDEMDASRHALWWQLTLDFVDIARQFWPARLAELNRSSLSGQRNAALLAEATRVAQGRFPGPVIVAGSTGSIPATAALIAAVSRRADGAVILPGLDKTMSDSDWQCLAAGSAPAGPGADPAGRGHPQYGFFRLLPQLGVGRDEVRELGSEPPDLAFRAAILSQALLPTEATSGWRTASLQIDPEALQAAFEDVALFEASNEREEATAIAIALRLGLEGSDQRQAALVTPDRDLARRVVVELARFGIDADDSAGTPLAVTPQAELLRLLLDATLRPGDPVAVASLLKHPLATFGQDPVAMREVAARLERLALRGTTQAIDIADLAMGLERSVAEIMAQVHRRPWFEALSGEELEEVRALAQRIGTAVEPLASALFRRADGHGKLSSSLTLDDWAERSGRALEAVAMDTSGSLAGLWGDEAGASLATLLRTVIETDGRMTADGGQWCDIVEALLAGESVKPRAMRHPRVFIFGALESRLQHVDLVVLGGLNEGVWPGRSAENPFLSRSMKIEIGLEPPERRIGQLAHDLQMAFGTRNIVLTRALRQGSTPTVASRWLQRLLAVGGERLASQLKSRGERFGHWATALDAGISQKPAVRPEPRPERSLQPTRYSFSEVGRLRRDPYAVYARRILRLEPIDPFAGEPGAAERGTLYHAIIERFVREVNLDPDSVRRMELCLAEAFDEAGLPPHVDLVWRQRFRAVGQAFIKWEEDRRPDIRRSWTETSASLPIGVGNVLLTGMADRIDLLGSGEVEIIDYKTGSSPTVKEARALLDPQLALEAAAAQAGGFTLVGRKSVQSLIYVRLKPGRRFSADFVNNDRGKANSSTEVKSAAMLGDESLSELRRLVSVLLSGERGFASRLVVQKERSYGGDYDHLARVAEWATAEADEDALDS